MSTQNLRNKKW